MEETHCCRSRQGAGRLGKGRTLAPLGNASLARIPTCFSNIHPYNRIYGRATAPATDSPTSNLLAQINVSLAQVQSLCRTPIHSRRQMKRSAAGSLRGTPLNDDCSSAQTDDSAGVNDNQGNGIGNKEKIE